ncbi:hypothetical protein [Streptomyces sp. NBC_00154]|uniref:hypothetical protein n=1 Tax=Streptomyces sp. NBC_00154 TaxID=2975670 RepID=UPI00225AEB12|nr:hypothetical protein [Streptomyces sp. NBC_00154]MCX5317460.1 hypothetical protein [Streptomyces sp. NBC_00154]
MNDLEMPMDGPLSEADLDAMGKRTTAASPGPWVPWLETRGATGGESFIQVGPGHAEQDDEIHVHRIVGARQVLSPDRQLDADLDFIAWARQDIARLIAEVRRLRAVLVESDSPDRHASGARGETLAACLT